jgi:hypothetical protein
LTAYTSLQTLQLRDCGLVGSLPADWTKKGAFGALSILDIGLNALTGPLRLPGSCVCTAWGWLGGCRRLARAPPGQNTQLSGRPPLPPAGALPSSLGKAGTMASVRTVSMEYNR